MDKELLDFIDDEDTEEYEPEPTPGLLKSLILGTVFVGSFFLICGFFFWQFLNTAPVGFPVNQEFVITPGTGVKEVAKLAKDNEFIRSEWALYYKLRFSNQNETIKAGTYNFAESVNLDQLVSELIKGNPKAELLKLTLIEGEPNLKVARRAEEALAKFNSTEFLVLASTSEGRLFPETYFITKDFSAEDLFLLLSDTFTEKITPLQDQIENSKLSLDEIIILASIIEREANSTTSMRMVSGILQNRLNIGMALQADASIEYILDKPLSALVPKDLEIDSPYNTYLYPGLPPTPIGNPGLEAILAVLSPTPSDNFFYITGNDGEFYYAKNFDAHRVNIAKHLR